PVGPLAPLPPAQAPPAEDLEAGPLSPAPSPLFRGPGSHRLVILSPYPPTKHRLRSSIEIVGGLGVSLVWYWRSLDFNSKDWDLKWDAESWRRKLNFDAVRFDPTLSTPTPSRTRGPTRWPTSSLAATASASWSRSCGRWLRPWR